MHGVYDLQEPLQHQELQLFPDLIDVRTLQLKLQLKEKVVLKSFLKSILTAQKLRKRWMDVNECPKCKEAREEINFLCITKFVECNCWTKHIWSLMVNTRSVGFYIFLGMNYRWNQCNLRSFEGVNLRPSSILFRLAIHP